MKTGSLRPPARLLLPLLAAVGVLAASAASAQTPFGTSDPYESRFKVRPNFQIRFRSPQPGGEVRLWTKGPVEFEKDVYWKGSEDVVIEYQDVKITADRGQYDFPTDTATLEGHVVIDQGPTRLSGTRGVFNMKAKTGRLDSATADLSPAYHIVAESIEKVGEATYRIRHGIFTACDMPDPAWSFSLADALVTLDDYARMKNVAFRVRSVPLLFTPYLVWPTKEDRASGMLVPGVGYNQSRGAYLGLTHYWVTGRSTDLTSSVDLYSKGAYGLGEEFRWTPSPESAGIFRGYGIHDPQATVCVPASEEPSGGEGPCLMANGAAGVYSQRTRNRWKIQLEHTSNDLPYDVRGVLSVRDYSDDQYLQDLERSFALNSARQIFSRGFLTRNFGDNSVNLRAERSETFFGTTVLQERLPSLEFFRRTAPIGNTPLFFALESSVSYLYLNRGPGLPRGSYDRLDVHPTLSLPWKRIPWLSITANAGGRWTGWSDSTDDAETHFLGSSFTRKYGEAGVSIVGPSFSRIYEGQIGPFGKFKHIIEPRIDYTYVSDVTDPARIPAYDEVDVRLGQEQIRYAIVNRLLARPSDPKAGSAQEIASLEISQTHSFRLPQTLQTQDPFQTLLTKDGPVEAVLRLVPGSLFQFDGRADFDTHAGQFTSASASASVGWKTNFVNATWFASRPILASPLPPGSPSPDSDQFRLAAGLNVAKWLRVDTQINYDARQRLILEDRSLLEFRGSCYTVFLEVRQLRIPPTPRRDYRLVVNLKDIGTLLDVNGSIDSLFGSH